MRTTFFLSIMFCAVTYGGEAPPAEALILKKQRDAKVAQTQEAFIEELSKLRDKYTKDGETEKSAAVTTMIEEAKDGTPAAPAAPKEPTDRQLVMLIGKWRRDYDKAIFEFKDTKSGIYGGNTPFTLHYDPVKKRAVMTANRWVDSVSFTLNDDILRGGHDNKIPYKLTRIR